MSNREFPILFSTIMVQAILEGRKNQTRRICKPQPYSDLELRLQPIAKGLLLDVLKNVKFKIGDILWVRETWRPTMNSMPIGWPYDYKATAKEDCVPEEGPWKTSIFMPKVACRLKLRVTDIRVERVQDISEWDAISEGILDAPNMCVIGFRQIWEKINGKDSWNSNPWVWVLTFKKL